MARTFISAQSVKPTQATPSLQSLSESFPAAPDVDVQYAVEVSEKKKKKSAFYAILTTTSPCLAEHVWCTLSLDQGRRARLLRNGVIVEKKSH